MPARPNGACRAPEPSAAAMATVTRLAVVAVARDASVMAVGLLLAVAAEAGELRVVVRDVVARRAARPAAVMLPGVDPEKGGIVRGEPCARPGRGRVALRAVGGEHRQRVVRIAGAVVRRLMARDAGGALAYVHAVSVATRATHRGVRAGQPEARPRVAEPGGRPQGRRVTLRTVRRESGRRVIGRGRREVGGAVTVHAVRRLIDERQTTLRLGPVALL